MLVGNPEGKRNSEELDVDGKIILKWILQIYGGKVWTVYIWFRIGTSGDTLRTR
jgi:hypothetical protein